MIAEKKGREKMKRYIAGRYSDKVETVEVERETNFTVWIKGRKWSKKNKYEEYFDTFEEARESLVNRYQFELKTLKAQLKRTKQRLADTLRLQEES